MPVFGLYSTLSRTVIERGKKKNKKKKKIPCLSGKIENERKRKTPETSCVYLLLSLTLTPCSSMFFQIDDDEEKKSIEFHV